MVTLALDMGTNSLGWALLGGPAGAPSSLIDGGVLVFPSGRERKSDTTNAATRRAARALRRNRDRGLRRQRSVASRLRGLGLLPSDEAAIKVVRALDPLELRAAALDRSLEPYELGRVILSFSRRRGFQSNRRETRRVEDDGQVLADAETLTERIRQSGARTLGEYLWRRRQRGKTVRARSDPDGKGYGGLYPTRAMVREEFGEIRARQEGEHRLAAEDWDWLSARLLGQRPLKPVEPGPCSHLPAEKRAHRAYPLVQEFRIRQEVQLLRLGPRQVPLTADQQDLAIERLLGRERLSFRDLAKLLGGSEQVNLESSARKGMDGDRTATVLAGPFGGRKAWAQLGPDRQGEIVKGLLERADAGECERWLRDDCGLPAKQAARAAAASLPQGTSHLSLKAIMMLLPHMRDGMPYDKAVIATGLGSRSQPRGDGSAGQLPYYGKVEDLRRYLSGARADGGNDEERYGRIANPTVHIALGQLRRLFNAICEEYGKPDSVVVELARELKQNQKQREEYTRRQARNRRRDDEIARSIGRSREEWENAIRPRDRVKLRLWHEQRHVCPYTGRPLSLEMVLSDETDIDHILPRSKTLDDSMANKVLVLRDANRDKLDRSPFEAWGDDSDRKRYDAILARVASQPSHKRERFLPNAMEQWDGGFLGRQLNDTRYLSRLARRYLEEAVPDVRVTPGRLTAMLRRVWGLDSLLSETDGKDRTDHRHHLIDAVVVGVTTRSMLQRVSRAYGRNPETGKTSIASLERPWPSFRDDLLDLLDRCVVRHRPDVFRPVPNVTSGALHRETAYGVVREEGDWVEVVTRKNLADLKENPGRLEHIRDAALRRTLLALWDSTEGSGAAAWRRFVRRAWAEHRVRKARMVERKKRDSLVVVTDENTGARKAYESGANAYMDIWMLPSGEITDETVSRFAAHQPDFASRIRSKHATARKVLRLHRDDMVAIGTDGDRRIMRVRSLTSGKINLVPQYQGGKAKETTAPTFSGAVAIRKQRLRKLDVDVLGRVRQQRLPQFIEETHPAPACQTRGLSATGGAEDAS